jgi:hypothetical protein
MKLTTTQLCKMFSISPRLLAMTKQIHARACPELVQMLRAGEISVNLALQICRTHHEGQRLILAEFPGMKSRERTAFVRRVFEAAAQEVA